MSAPVYIALGDLATEFPVLPTRLADALDVYGPNALAWAWVEKGLLVKLEVGGN